MSNRSEINWKLLGITAGAVAMVFVGIIIFKGRAVKIGLPILLLGSLSMLTYGILVAIGWIRPSADPESAAKSDSSDGNGLPPETN